MSGDETNDAAVALAALGWTLGEDDRAARLLALTGLTPDGLRGSLSDPVTLAATIRFLEGHEPDLLACADHLGIAPSRLTQVRQRLES